MMNVKETVQRAAEELKEAGIEEYRLEAELFMAEVLHTDRLGILTDGSREVSAEERAAFDKMICRRKKHEPFAYIVGRREFMGLNFSVKEGILIPRPDTEILVESVIEASKQHGFKTSAEVGVGSGCISVSLAAYTDMMCFGTDISPTAVETAEKNSAENSTADKTRFFLGDIFSGLPEMTFDVIVSNPPYIREKDMDTLMTDVKDYEPTTALYGGVDGLDFYRRITAEGKPLLNRGGYIFYEIGYDEAAEVSDILAQNGFVDIRVIKDLSGLDRVVSARKGDFDD